MYNARFAHDRLDAYPVIREALVRGDAIARGLPRGYAKLADQLRRELLGAFLQFVEGAARDGDDRKARLRSARRGRRGCSRSRRRRRPTTHSGE